MTNGAVESHTATCTRPLLSLRSPATNMRQGQRRERGRAFPGVSGGLKRPENLNAEIGERFRLVSEDVFSANTVLVHHQVGDRAAMPLCTIPLDTWAHPKAM
jgi:hypothetical protein